ncbi:methyl-accepting chemotaxis protein [Vibrio sp. 16]|uniref:methyl-accepting chemotaxis protein n=1 Tax=Vibrio TaxID=662 RepID=UPI0005805597|nr:methyl-accepting chemotaxis protein [Vibrio sinaloensis]KHT44075.1 chemotaxis protein [Vibrio sinaloensis]
MKNISFKNKIVVLIISIIFTTILTSFISVNYFISHYIQRTDTQSITHSIDLIQQKLEKDLQSKLNLATSLNFSMMDISETKESSGFYRIVKIVNGYAFDDSGNMSDEAAEQFIAQAESHGEEIKISPVTMMDGLPVITFSIKRLDDSVDFFVLNLTDLGKVIDVYTYQGSYAELTAGNIKIFSNTQAGNFTPVNRSIELGEQTWQLTGYIDNDSIAANTASLSWNVTIALAVIGVVIVVLSVLLLQYSFKPLMRLKELVADLAQGNGDLTRRLSVEKQDEIGEISSSINQFIEKLQTMFIEVSDSSKGIDSAVRDISQQSSSNLHTLNQHTQETEQVITAVEEMSASAVSIAQSAENAAQLTEQANRYSEQSKQTVANAVESVSNLVEQVTSMSSTISTMDEDTKQISTVLQVIGEIAEQTNLLALNAAIEAARAGEQGRGFAVVADEVRALAGRTQQSTSQINEMLQKLKETTNSVVNEMDVTRQSCEATAEHTEQVMLSLNEVTDSVTEINEVNIHVSTSAQQQRQVTDEVSRNMVAIQDIIHTLNGNASQAAAVSDELSGTSRNLSSVVAQFKVQ